MNVTCPYCDRVAKLVTGHAIYPHRPDLFGKKFYLCSPCGAWVGCHPNGRGDKPLGRLANAELRKAKQVAHAAFDPLWKSGMMSRASAYKRLAESMQISRDNCHIGMFDVEQCGAVVLAVQLIKQSHGQDAAA